MGIGGVYLQGKKNSKMSNRKFLKVEKVLIADVDVSKYTTYDCKERFWAWRRWGIESPNV